MERSWEYAKEGHWQICTSLSFLPFSALTWRANTRQSVFPSSSELKAQSPLNLPSPHSSVPGEDHQGTEESSETTASSEPHGSNLSEQLTSWDMISYSEVKADLFGKRG